MNKIIDDQNVLFDKMLEEDEKRDSEPKLYQSGFIRDGIVDEEEYLKHYPRVVFLGKNPHRSTGLDRQLSEAQSLNVKIFDQLAGLRGSLADSATTIKEDWEKSRKVIARWLAEIHGLKLRWEDLKRESDWDEWCVQQFKKLVLVDVMKTFSDRGSATTEDGEEINGERQNHTEKQEREAYSKELEAHIKGTRELLLEQIRLYHPHIVVSLGLEDMLIQILFDPKKEIIPRTTYRGWLYYIIETEGQVFPVILYLHFSPRSTKHHMLHYCLMDAIEEVYPKVK